MWHAHLDTRHYSFDAFGKTKESARAAMYKGMRIHALQSDIDGRQFIFDYDDGIGFQEVKLGGCYIDHDRELTHDRDELTTHPARESS